MDPVLNDLLERYGLQLDASGDLTNYHGWRRPYHVELKEVMARTYKHYRSIWDLVTDHGNILPAKRTANTAIHEKPLSPAHPGNIYISRCNY